MTQNIKQLFNLLPRAGGELSTKFRNATTLSEERKIFVEKNEANGLKVIEIIQCVDSKL
jgi:hypothetical protein